MKVTIKRLNINNWQIYIDGKLVTDCGEIRTRQTAVFIAGQKLKGYGRHEQSKEAGK